MSEIPKFEFLIPQTMEGMRLDACAAKLAPDLSRVQIQRVIEGDGMFLNGKVISEKRTKVHSGDTLQFSPPAPQKPVSAEGEDIPLDVLYEDDSILVINKPAGMVVHPAAGNWSGTVVNAVLGRFSVKAEDFENADPLRPGIVHRLDRDTSGCLVIARTESAMHRLSACFQERKVSKTYLTVVSPAPKVNSAEIKTFIGRSPVNRKKMAVVRDAAHGKNAETHFNCIKRGWIGRISAALLEVRIMTGRTHQIRVHMSHFGSPVAGDEVYGGMHLPESRQMLHAWKITFPHPETEELLSFEAPLPADLQDCINRISEEKSEK